MTGGHTKRKHSDFAASAASRWLTCPGSVQLSKKAPPQEESPFAIEGTRAHECLEYVVKRGGKLTGVAEKQARAKWNDEMIAHALESAKRIFELRPSEDAKLLVETRVHLNIASGMFGTLDYAWVDLWGDLIVIDYKYGAGVPVLPIDDETGEPNPQLMYYALGLCQKYDFEFDRVKLAVLQPRVWKDDEDPLTVATVTIAKMREFEDKVRGAVQAAKSPQAWLRASPDACRWCPASSFCPEVSKGQMDKAGIVFDVEEGVTKLPDVEALNEKTIAPVLDACDVLETWIASVRAYAFRLANEGKKIDGRKLVLKRSIRAWLPEAKDAADKEFGDLAFEWKMLSPAQLEKVFGKKAKEFTSKYTTENSSGVTLVKESDRRPEVDPNVFDTIDE